MTWWRILRHRFVAVPLVLASLVAAWNVYIVFNSDGIIAGTVVDSQGHPVPGAEVVFYARNFVNYQEAARTTADAAGAWRFDGMQVHVGQLEAHVRDGRRSERLQLRLWFRGQNVRLAPLMLGPAKS